MHILLVENPIEHVLPHDLFRFPIGHFWVTNQMLMALVAGAIMLIVFPRLFNKPTDSVPTGWRNFFESILEFLRVEVFRPALKEHTDRFVPFLWTLFFFILFCNLLGFLPLSEVLGLLSGGRLRDIGGTPTGSIITTGVLAVTAFFFIHINGVYQVARSLIDGTYGHHPHHEEHSSDGSAGHDAAMDLDHMRGDALSADVPQKLDALGHPTAHYHDDEHRRHHGAAGEPGPAAGSGHGMNPAAAAVLAAPLYLWNFAPHPFKPKPGESPIGWLADIPLWGLLLVLELVGAVIKPFALAIRLFANMIAGHLVLAVLIGLILVSPHFIVQLGVGIPMTVLSLLIRVLELFVAFLQAYIFVFLTTLFIASAVAPEH